MDDSERKAGRNGGIDGVSSRMQHLNAGAGSKLVNAGDDSVRGVRGAQRCRRRADGEQAAADY